MYDTTTPGVLATQRVNATILPTAVGEVRHAVVGARLVIEFDRNVASVTIHRLTFDCTGVYPLPSTTVG